MSSLSTGRDSSGASPLRRRSCARPACGIPRPLRKEKCCDEDCILEVARRACNKEGCHDGPPKLHQRNSGGEITATNVNNTTIPCEDHYQKTKAKYGAFLENLGCICEILLSLDIESCCVIPFHSPARSAGSRSSKKSGTGQVTAASHKPTAVTMQDPDESCHRGCCGTPESSEIHAKAVHVNTPSNGCGERCSTNDSSAGINSVLSKHGQHHSQDYLREAKSASRAALTVAPKGIENSPPMCGVKKAFSDEETSGPDNPAPATLPRKYSYSGKCCSSPPSTVPPGETDDLKQNESKGAGHAHESQDLHLHHAGEKCGYILANLFPLKAKIPDIGKSCCGNVSCQSEGTSKPPSTTKTIVETLDSGADEISFGDSDNIDVEQALHRVEHLIVRVVGMDCTGCEKKLYRSLAGLPELRNIKTSLLLGQAEFDLVPSQELTAQSIIRTMEKMTGFTCTRILHAGVELELIVEGNPHLFLEGWPVGVSDIAILSKTRIQVSYHPKVVGARDLLSGPFFERTILAPPSAAPLIAFERVHLLYSLYMTVLSAILTIPVLILTWAPVKPSPVRYGAVSLALATFVQVVIAGPFYRRTANALIFSRMIDMDLLIVLSSSAAYLYSVISFGYLVAGKPLTTEQFFETSTLLVTLIMVGRTISAFARQRAVESIAIESLQTPTAILIDQTTQKETEIDSRLLQYGDAFRVIPDMSVVTDGIVVSGESEIDESMITGEAILIAKKAGVAVVAGSVNHSGSLVVKVTRLPSENTIKTIGDLVDEAKKSKPKVQELADRLASYFVPGILVITTVVFVVRLVVGMVVRGQKASPAAISAMTFSISVLIVSCPCAIGLAVPMVVVVAGGVAARHGLIFKTAETIDTGRKISHVVFDKTGTLTKGRLSVSAETYLTDERNALLSIVLGLTVNSKHPVSKAIAIHLLSQNIQPSEVSNIVSVAGNGIEGTSKNSIIRAGNPYWLKVQDEPKVRKFLPRGLTLFCITIDDKLAAVYGLQDELREDALSTITELKRRNIEISIISGDNEAAVQAVAIQLGLPNVRSRCSPEEKQAYVKSLLDSHDDACDGDHDHGSHEHKHKHSSFHLHTHNHSHALAKTVLFIGDGTNDAPSLAQASIGLHISEGGTDVASSAADAVLMRPSLSGILTLIDLSKAFHRRVVFNFVWSAVYNLFAILLAAGVFSAGRANVRIPPEYAGLGEVVSVVPVVGIAVGLRWWKG